MAASWQAEEGRRAKVAVSPSEYLGFQPGDDRKLASWDEITGYFRELAKNSDRMRWFDMGQSTEDRPFYYICVSSPDNLRDLDEYKTIQGRLADPRSLTRDEAQELTEKGKTIVLISCSIHASEVGAAQMSMELAYELETAQDARTKEILNNVILLLVPSLNPDGLDMVVDWYKKYLDTTYEGSPLPFLYQKYAGHDNNRDWFMLNLVENRLTVQNIHNVWHPHIVFDLHQMGSLGFRLFVPPYMDPWDPNVDYILRQETAELGFHMMSEVLSTGRTGVSCYNMYDAYAPSRAFQHYHGGVRILSEAASVRLATPVKTRKDELRPTRDGADPREASWNHPAPWQGGEWRLRDIVEYEKVAAYGCLDHAAKFRAMWVTNFEKLSWRACERTAPYAAVFPADQADPVMVYELLKVLSMGQVEIHRAEDDFEVDGVFYRKGTHVVLFAQPYGAYAKTLLEKQEYPDLRMYPGGPPKLPYDVTGHTLPLLMGVKVAFAEKPFRACLKKLEAPMLPRGGVFDTPPQGVPVSVTESWLEPGGRRAGDRFTDAVGASAGASAAGGTYLALSPTVNSAAKVVNGLLGGSREVLRTTRSVRVGGDLFPAGTFLIPENHRDEAETLCRLFGVRAQACDGTRVLAVPTVRLKACKTGVYKSHRPVADEGWLRLVLEEYGFPYESVDNRRIRNGGLAGEFDAIVFPSQTAAFIADGNGPGTLPPEYTGGLGVIGKDAIQRFLEEGGTCLFLDAAAAWAVNHLGLPCRNVLADKQSQEFFAPGSILRVVMDTRHPLAYGLNRETPVLFERGPAWEVSGGAVVGRHPTTDPLMSGWLLGGQFLNDKAALVEFRVGQGRVVLVGFYPHFRAQARNTYKVIFNGIYMAGSEPMPTNR